MTPRSARIGTLWPVDVRRLLGRRPAPPPRRQRILITGASSGLGAQMARVWYADGRDLVLCARRRDELERLRDELLARPASSTRPTPQVEVHELDVRDLEQLDAVFAAASAALGGLDRVVANAGIGKGAPVGTGRHWANRSTLQTNAVGTLNTAEAAVQLFRAAGAGHLVLISSIAALRGLSGARTGYAASKAAISAIGEGLWSELRDTDIAVSTVHPGYIDTAMSGPDPKKRWSLPLADGTRLLVAAIESERPLSYVPALPWDLIAAPLRVAPRELVRRILD